MIKLFLGKKENHYRILKIWRKFNRQLMQKVEFNNLFKKIFNPIILILCLLSNGNKLWKFLKMEKNKRLLSSCFRWMMIFTFWDLCSSMDRIFCKISLDLPHQNYSKKCFQFKKQTLCNKCFSKWSDKQPKLRQVNFWQILKICQLSEAFKSVKK